MRQMQSGSRSAGALATSIALVLSGAANAADSTGATSVDAAARSSGLLDEVVVSAQKREQNLQSVGIAVAAFSAEKLESRGISSSTEIAQITPGVHIGGAAAGQFVTFTIRGVTQNDFADHTESPTAVYVDEGYIASMQGQTFALFDLERVEIIKGPQGTLFGRNATGGLVHFVTKAPSFEPDGFLDVTYGSYDQAKLEGAFGGALTDSIAFRVAGFVNRFDELLENSYVRADGRKADDEWNDETVSGRAQLLFRPSDDLDVRVMLHGGRSRKSTSPYDHRPTIAVLDGQGRVVDSLLTEPTETRFAIIPPGATGVDPTLIGVRPVPGADWGGYAGGDANALRVNKNFSDDDSNEFRMHGGAVHVAYTLGDLVLNANTDYVSVSKDVLMDIDASPRSELVFPAIARTWNASQEFRLSDSSGATRWVAGAYYLHIVTDAETGFVIGPPVDAPAAGIRQAGPYARDLNDLTTDSYSLFGQIERDLTPTVTLIAGLRGTLEEKEFSYVSDFLVNGPFVANTRDFQRDTSDFLWSGKLQLDWRAADDVLLYAGVNRGVKAGSFNAPLAGNPVVTDAQLEYGPETLYSYEVGIKSEFLDRRARLNGAVYYYDYRNYQASLFLGLAQRILNSKATTKGAEASFVVSPLDGLDLELSAAYVDTDVEAIAVNGVVRDRKAAFAPEWSASTTVRYTRPISTGSVYVQADAAYTGHFYYSLNNFTSSRIGDYVLGDVSVGWQSADERWSASAFVKNVGDERYDVVGFDLSTAGGYSERSYGLPRWWGASVRYRFR